jgi:hypothetical protein
VTINLALIRAAYSDNKFSANLSIAAGTYMNANLATEPGVLKNIYEAYLGVKLSKNNKWWFDAGIMPSHIGFESAISKDCWTLTRSLLADNSPYYEAGVKVSYSSTNKNWKAAGLLMNGWQRIQRVEGNQSIALGHQLQYTPNKKVLINSSSFIGNDKPDSIRQMRYFHNLYGQVQLTDKWAILTGLDMGMEQKSKGSRAYNTWYSTILITRFAIYPEWMLAVRCEYYNDKNQVIIKSASQKGFNTFGYSLNLDYVPIQNIIVRVEIRKLLSRYPIFISDQELKRNNLFMSGSIAISL